MMTYIGEIGCMLTVPRSLATPELGQENFRFHESRKELTRRLKLESQLHNTIRTWNNRLVRLNLQTNGKLTLLEGRVPHFAQIARLPVFSSRPCQNSEQLRCPHLFLEAEHLGRFLQHLFTSQNLYSQFIQSV